MFSDLAATGARQPVRVAVVDDDRFVRRALSRLLRGAGYGVELYESGEAFLAAVEVEMPHCALLDIRLGGLSGPDVKQELDRRGLPIRVIFMTAHSEEETRNSLLSFPEIEVLRKPFSAGQLMCWLTNGHTV
jgi:FixJ family two-component response regulator